jgi:hypothetical protein
VKFIVCRSQQAFRCAELIFKSVNPFSETVHLLLRCLLLPLQLRNGFGSSPFCASDSHHVLRAERFILLFRSAALLSSVVPLLLAVEAA